MRFDVKNQESMKKLIKTDGNGATFELFWSQQWIYSQPQASQKRYIEYILYYKMYTYVEIAGIENLQTGMQLLYKSLLHLPQFFVGSLVEGV